MIRFDKDQRAMAKQKKHHLIAIVVDGREAKEASISFAGPMPKWAAERVKEFMTKLVQELEERRE